MAVPAPVTVVTDHYLRLADDAVGDRLVGLYLYGSVALDDFRPGASDIDFVGVLDARPDPATLDALREVHRQLAQRFPRPHFDGIYLTWEDLAADPFGTSGPYVHEHRFDVNGGFERGPVTWHSLAQSGVTVRGPGIDSVKIATDPGDLADWTHGNLDGYWRDWWTDASKSLSAKGMAALSEPAIAWGVLGVSRLHYTLECGRITSKTGAGEYARGIFGSRWHRILDEAVRIRTGSGRRSSYRNPLARRTDALAYMDMAIEDAHYGDPQYRHRNVTRRHR